MDRIPLGVVWVALAASLQVSTYLGIVCRRCVGDVEYLDVRKECP